MNPARLAIGRKTTTLILTLVLLAGGVVSFLNLGRLEDPEYTIKQAVVTTQYPGANPLQVEEEVTETLEVAIQQLAQMDEVESRSMHGLSIITVTIKDHYLKDDLPQVWDELRRKVGAAQALLPPGAGPPQVNDDFGDVYGIFFAVTGQGYTYAEKKEFVDRLRKELLLVKGVAKVALYGLRPETVYVEMSSRRMSQLGVSPDQIYQALSSRNLIEDSGLVKVGSQHIPIGQAKQFSSAKELGGILISGGGSGKLIRLRDVAEIKRGYQDPPVSILRHNGLSAIGIGISIVPGGNVIELGKAVKAKLAELKDLTPVGMELHPINYQADLVQKAVDGFLISLAEAVAIVIAVLMIFMGLRSGLIIGAGLLITIAATFLVMDILDINLQRISLGALVLALGMLVDNAIVVTEGILVKTSQGMDSEEAAAKTVRQTAWPLAGATIVAVLAFAALGLSNNSAGEFCASLFSVMLISLSLSWVLAITVTPLMCHMFLKPASPDPDFDPYSGLLFRIYRPFLFFSLRHRLGTMLVMVFLLAASIFGFRFVSQSFFPDSTRPAFLVDYWLPQGTHIERTSEDLRKFERFVGGLPGVSGVSSFVGQGGLRYALTVETEFPNPAYGQLKVEVDDYRTIDGLLPKVADYAREEFPDAQCTLLKFRLGPGTAGKIRARLIGEDPETLRKLATKISAIMAQEPNTRDINQSWRQQVKLLKPILAEAQAERNAIGPRDVARTLRESFSGLTVGVYRERDKLLPIVVRPPADERASVDALGARQIWSPASHKMIPLSQVVSSYEVGWEEGVVRRKDRMRTMEVICDPITGTAASLLDQLRPRIEALQLPEGYRLEWGGEYEDSKEANEAVFANVPLTTLLMVLIVLVMFNALRQPLIIFLCLPLSIIGVTVGLLATGLPMNFMAVLGFLSLSGMLIKNSVVLVDQIDLDIREGQPILQAIKSAAVSRARPVLMAAVTTVLGMAPLLSDAFYSAMAVTIMAGLSFATILTLIVVPVLYALFFRAERA